MQTELSTELFLSASMVDFTGRWRPSAILESMQDLATAHSEAMGLGRALMLDRGIIWLLSRTHLQIREYPMMDETVRIRTWPGVANRFFYPRYFSMERLDGRQIGAASSLWLLLDLHNRSTISPQKSGISIPDTSHIPPSLPTPDRVTRLSNGALSPVMRSAVYSDLDVNRHLNNARYADWACDLFPLEMLHTHCVENLLFNYTNEVLPGVPIQCTMSLEDNRFSLLGESQDGALPCFEIGGTLAPWHSDRRV